MPTALGPRSHLQFLLGDCDCRLFEPLGGRLQICHSELNSFFISQMRVSLPSIPFSCALILPNDFGLYPSCLRVCGVESSLLALHQALTQSLIFFYLSVFLNHISSSFLCFKDVFFYYFYEYFSIYMLVFS